MGLLVQKFGGTSVATPQLRKLAAAKITKAKNEGRLPVVVVSAIGRKGQPYATDTLINLVKETSRDVAPRELDLIMSCGEIISGVIMTALLQELGQPSVFLTGAQAGIITDGCHNQARILKVDTRVIERHLSEGKIVVVAGFQGVTEEGEITTLGRGGSDTTAAALGVALGVDRIDIYTDVDGIMTADPSIVSDARVISEVTYDEVCQLAHEGARVIHPRSVEIAMQGNIPLRVMPIMNDGPGTLIGVSGSKHTGVHGITRDRIVTGITQKAQITQFILSTSEGTEGTEQRRKIFKNIALAGISLDFISVSPGKIVFTVRQDVSQKAIEIIRSINFSPTVTNGCAKVAAVGAGMTGVPGVMANIIETLAEEEIEVLQANDSYTTIWVLVKEEDMKKAVRVLHDRFLSNKGQSAMLYH